MTAPTAAANGRAAKATQISLNGRPLPVISDLAPGQIWKFDSLRQPGHSHRLIIGSCRRAETLACLLDGRPAQGIFTSPIYADRRRNTYGGIPADEYVAWWEPVQAFARKHLASDGSFFVNIKAHVADGERQLYVNDLVAAMVRRWRWRYLDDLCWKRQGYPGKFPNRFKNAHEPIYHFALDTEIKFRPQNVLVDSNLSYASDYDARGADGNATMGSAFDGRTAARNVKSKHHKGALPNNIIEAYTGAHSPGTRYGASFPVELPEFFVRAFSDPGDIWLDLFAGSGTLAEAAERHGRLAYLVDKSPLAALETMLRLARLGLSPCLVTDVGAAAVGDA